MNNGVSVETEEVPNEPVNIGTDDAPKYEFFTANYEVNSSELGVAQMLFQGTPVVLTQKDIEDTITEQGINTDLYLIKITIERVGHKPAGEKVFTHGN